MRLVVSLFFTVSFIAGSSPSFAINNHKINVDSTGQLYSRCFSMMAFHNEYYMGRRGALEFVLHGDRIASNGDIRLNPIPIPDGAFDPHPQFIERITNAEENSVTARVINEALDISYHIKAIAEGNNIRVIAKLEKPLPDSLLGRLGFMLELFPGHYKGKSYSTDQQKGIFPLQFNGTRAYGDNGLATPPLATGKKLVLAPEDPYHHITIQTKEGEIELLDGRASTNHKWYIIRQKFTKDHAPNQIEWLISPNIVENWMRDPVVGFSQIGYLSSQKKISVIEMDAIDTPDEISLIKILPNGDRETVLSAKPEIWGMYYRRKYARFDFSEVKEEGLYALKYRDQITEAFHISEDQYKSEFWRPTLETFIPAQMCHVEVWDRIIKWHGACHLDDARQAPPGLEHFDHYHMDDQTNTPFKGYEHIPGLNQGGWHDAGDSDIESPSNSSTLYTLSLAYEEFGLQSDQTFVDYTTQMVRLHEPDGRPDLLQQIVHGVKYISGNYDAFGQYSRGVISPEFEQYLMMGDVVTQTDGLIYDPSLSALQRTATHSGKNDDRLVFTNYNIRYEIDAGKALAAASRALKEYDLQLSDKCLNTALSIWENAKKKDNSHAPEEENQHYRGYREILEKQLAAELFLCTGADEFREELNQRPEVSGWRMGYYLWSMCRVADKMNDPHLDAWIRLKLPEYQENLNEQISGSPYQVPHIHTLFGTGFRYLSMAMMHYYFCKSFPEIVSEDFFFHVVDYMHGNHPVSNHSLVTGVGAKSITSAYGFNRANRSYVPGGICAGPLLIEPDFIEFQIDDPFFWVQKEYTIASGATYVFVMLALEEMGKSWKLEVGSSKLKTGS